MEPFHFIFMAEEKFFSGRDIEKPGWSDHFPEETGCVSWFCKINVIIELQSAFNNSSIDNNNVSIFYVERFRYFFNLNSDTRNF